MSLLRSILLGSLLIRIVDACVSSEFRVGGTFLVSSSRREINERNDRADADAAIYFRHGWTKLGKQLIGCI